MPARSLRPVLPAFGHWEEQSTSRFTAVFDGARITRRGSGDLDGDSSDDDTPVLGYSRPSAVPKLSDSGARTHPVDRYPSFPPEKVSPLSHGRSPPSGWPIEQHGSQQKASNVTKMTQKPQTAAGRPRYEADLNRAPNPSSAAQPGDYYRPRGASKSTAGPTSRGSESRFEIPEPAIKTPMPGKRQGTAVEAPQRRFPEFGHLSNATNYTAQFDALKDSRDSVHRERTPSAAAPRSPREDSGTRIPSSKIAAYETVRREPGGSELHTMASRDDKPVGGVRNSAGAPRPLIGQGDRGRNRQPTTAEAPGPIPSFGFWQQDCPTDVSQAFENHRPNVRKAVVESPKPYSIASPSTQAHRRQWSDGSGVERGAVRGGGGQNFKKVVPETRESFSPGAGKVFEVEKRVQVEKRAATVVKKPESASCFSCLAPRTRD